MIQLECTHELKMTVRFGEGFDDKIFWCEACGAMRNCKSHEGWRIPLSTGIASLSDAIGRLEEQNVTTIFE